MQNKKVQFILGSASPRRKELLQWTYIPFQILTSDFEEHSEEPIITDFVMDLASQKARDVLSKISKLNKYSCPMVLGSDTIVSIDDQVLGKPKSREQARDMLKMLESREHKVFTGVCINFNNNEYKFFDETTVMFSKITDDLMELYLDTGESMDKAGAYGIQGAALGFIEKVSGSYSNVVGLPVNLVLEHIKKILNENKICDVTDENWRAVFE